MLVLRHGLEIHDGRGDAWWCDSHNFVGGLYHFDAEDVSMLWGGLHHFELVTKKLASAEVESTELKHAELELAELLFLL